MLVALFLVSLSYSNGLLLDDILRKNVCYGALGCFGTGAPFTSSQRPLSVVPQAPDVVKTTFHLFTRQTPSISEQEIVAATHVPSITGSHFDGSRPTKFIIHGFTHNGQRQWLHNMKTELLKQGDMNVFIVYWGHGATPPYTQATANTRLVGAQVAQLIEALVSHGGASVANIHVIGHSLGAHVAGYAGERIPHLSRISGLDPAEPYFKGTDVRVRLDPSDAEFVDVLHSDGSSMFALGFGSSQVMGHVDFYPNGGKNQPGCPVGPLAIFTGSVWSALSHLDLLAAEGTVACSHERSYELYTESINSHCPFKAYPCTSAKEFHKGHCLQCYSGGCSRMGFHANEHSARGSMYLETEARASFCDYNYELNVTATNSFDGKLTVSLTGTTGSVGPIHLMTSNEIYNPGMVINKLVKSRTDIGQVTSVTATYDKSSTFLVSSIFSSHWHLHGMSLWSGDKQKKLTFCAPNKDLNNHHVATFGLTGTC